MKTSLIIFFAVATACAHAQQDPPQWNSTSAFIGGGLARGADGNFYRALRNNTGHDPTKDNHTFWELYYVRSPLKLTVASSKATFNSLLQAWSFIQGATIASSASIQIGINTSNGNFSEAFTTGFTLNHPFGAYVTIVGDDRTKISLVFAPGSQGFLLDHGNSFGGISDVTIDGTSAINQGRVGITVDDHSFLNNTAVSIKNFDDGVDVLHFSSARLSKCAATSIGTNFSAQFGSTVLARSCTSNGGTSGFYAAGGSFLDAGGSSATASIAGFQAVNGSTLDGSNSAAGACITGYLAQTHSGIEARASAAAGCTTGYGATMMSHIDATSVTVSGNNKDFSPPANVVSADNCLISH